MYFFRGRGGGMTMQPYSNHRGRGRYTEYVVRSTLYTSSSSPAKILEKTDFMSHSILHKFCRFFFPFALDKILGLFANQRPLNWNVFAESAVQSFGWGCWGCISDAEEDEEDEGDGEDDEEDDDEDEGQGEDEDEDEDDDDDDYDYDYDHESCICSWSFLCFSREGGDSGWSGMTWFFTQIRGGPFSVRIARLLLYESGEGGGRSAELQGICFIKGGRGGGPTQQQQQ